MCFIFSLCSCISSFFCIFFHTVRNIENRSLSSHLLPPPKAEVMLSVASVCLSVCEQDYAKKSKVIFKKPCRIIVCCSEKNRLNFGIG